MTITQNNTNLKTKRHEKFLLYPELSYAIQGCFLDIRRQYGPGHKEVVYQRALQEKLQIANLKTQREIKINVYSIDTGKMSLDPINLTY